MEDGMKTKLTRILPDLVFAIIIFSSISMGYPLLGKILLTIYFLYLIYKSLPAIYATAGGNAYKKGNKEKALTYFKKAANSKKSKANFISSYGYLLLRDGKVSESEPYLEKAVELDDNLPQIKYSSLLNLSLLRWKQGRIPEAIKIAEDLKPHYLNSVYMKFLVITIYLMETMKRLRILMKRLCFMMKMMMSLKIIWLKLIISFLNMRKLKKSIQK